MAARAGEPGDEDTRVWVGRVKAGHETEHARFVEWLKSDEAHAIFRRKRLTEYALSEEDGVIRVVFRAPRTGDPRLLIDFLRYPGMWPDCWEFVSGGRGEGEPGRGLKVHWRRAPGPAAG